MEKLDDETVKGTKIVFLRAMTQIDLLEQKTALSRDRPMSVLLQMPFLSIRLLFASEYLRKRPAS